MAILYYAATAPVNPAGASPVLSPAQVWEGLRRKVRHADQFVPPITSCIVDKEEGNVVHRRVIFEGREEMAEVCTELAPHKVEFRLEDGTEVENVLAAGPSGGESDLYLTYSFKWKFPKIEQGSKEEGDMLAQQQKVSSEILRNGRSASDDRLLTRVVDGAWCGAVYDQGYSGDGIGWKTQGLDACLKKSWFFFLPSLMSWQGYLGVDEETGQPSAHVRAKGGQKKKVKNRFNIIIDWSIY